MKGKLLIFGWCCLILLVGCGQSGRLYLPQEPQATYDPANTKGRLS